MELLVKMNLNRCFFVVCFKIQDLVAFRTPTLFLVMEYSPVQLLPET